MLPNIFKIIWLSNLEEYLMKVEYFMCKVSCWAKKNIILENPAVRKFCPCVLTEILLEVALITNNASINICESFFSPLQKYICNL
jgi:hypothetical protein